MTNIPGSSDTPKFKYTKEEFDELPIKLQHLTLYINFTGDETGSVVSTICLEMTAIGELDEIALDAKDLEIISVESSTGPADEAGLVLDYEYLKEKDRLIVKLGRTASDGETFFVSIKAKSIPTDHILEGIYKDATQEGKPQQYVSQCQQWGFQRIMPIFDDCRAKCTMTTTIEADASYTNLISNGNISVAAHLKEGDSSRQVITYDNPIPMSPYLFLVCAGTWDTLAEDLTYPSGRTVRLEYLVPVGLTEEARIPMEILKESVLWIERTQGYEYTFDTYRTICMTKSNFGGMENLGNTTIVTDAALITDHTPDMMLLYAHAVIVHEFEHNQCGSETTMDTPFDVWLNEAYTVDVERQFMADIFDPAFVRLNQVDSVRAPLLGPLAIEDAGHYGRIVREGFNEPDELIDGVTYVKAAEVIRMLRLVVGEGAFIKGKRLYFDRYRGGNADTDQFFDCFEEVSGISLEGFKREWLYRIGYPKVTASTDYDSETKSYTIRFQQAAEADKEVFCLPISLALVDNDGNDIEGSERVFILNKFEDELTFEGLYEPPAFASMNRDFSFYGTFAHEGADTRTLTLQTRLDSNVYNRLDAMRKLTDRVRIALLEEPDGEVDREWLDLYGEILADESLSASLKARFLRIDEQPVDRKYSTWYQELVVAREKIMLAVNARYRGELLREYEATSANPEAETEGEKISLGIEARMLRAVLLGLIAIDDSRDSHRLILESYRKAKTAMEHIVVLSALNRSSEPSRCEILQEVYEKWNGHLSGYANYLRVISSGTRDDVFDMIRHESKRESFDITQPTWNRALFLAMASNNKMIWTDTGIEWLADRVIELAPINASTAGRLLNTFQNVHLLKPALSKKVMAALERIAKEVTAEVSVSIHGQAKAYIG